MRNTAFLVAPVALLAGVVAMKFGWAPNKDLDWDLAFPLWTGAHLAYLAGYLALGLVALTLWMWARDSARSAGERAGVHATAVATGIGLVTMIGQMVIDLLVGFEAGSRAEMSAISDRYHAIPGFDLLFYGLVPSLSLAGLAVLVLWLAARHRIAWWPALLFTTAAVAIGTRITALMVIGGVGVGVALYAVIRQERAVPAELAPSRSAGGVARR